jgi:hypothetical protein
MATTTTPTPKPADKPAEKLKPHDPAAEGTEPYDASKVQPYKPAPYMTDEKAADDKPKTPPAASGSTYTS